jgi:hypothetical protein
MLEVDTSVIIGYSKSRTLGSKENLAACPSFSIIAADRSGRGCGIELSRPRAARTDKKNALIDGLAFGGSIAPGRQ